MNKTKGYPYVHLMLRILTICLLIGWMGVIFLFSEQPGDESGDLSGHLSYEVSSVLHHVFHRDCTEEDIMLLAEKIDYPLRKAAHMTEYGILAVIGFFATISWPLRGKKQYWFPLTAAFLYAITDEIHQLYVPGRVGCATDVLIDTSGAAIALFIVWLLRKAFFRKKRNKTP